MSAAEQLRLATFMDDFVLTVYVSYTTSAKSNPLYERSADIEYLLSFIESNPGLAQHWQRFSGFIGSMQPEFPEMVAKAQAERRNQITS